MRARPSLKPKGEMRAIETLETQAVLASELIFETQFGNASD